VARRRSMSLLLAIAITSVLMFGVWLYWKLVVYIEYLEYLDLEERISKDE
jgi:hypothetical protein